MARVEDPELGVPHLDSRSKWKDTLCIISYCYCFLVFGLQVNLLGPTASELARSLGIVEADLGVIFTLTGFISIIGAVPAGWAIDRCPGHAVLAGSLMVEAVGFALLPFCSSLSMLAVTFGMVSFTWNFLNTGGNTFILWINREQQGEGVLINLVNALFGAGSLAAPLVAQLCVQLLGSSLRSYWLTAGLTAASAVSFCCLPSPKRPQGAAGGSDAAAAGSAGPIPDTAADAAGSRHRTAARRGSSEQEAPLLQNEHPTNGGLPAGSAIEDVQNAGSAGVGDATGRSWMAGGSLTLLLGIVAVFVWIGVGLEVAFGNWICTYAVQQLHMSEQLGRFVNAAYWAAFTAGRIVASMAAAVVKPGPMLLTSLPLGLVGAVLALLASPEFLLSSQGAPILGVAVLVGLGVSTAFANALSLLDSFAPITGTVTGVLGGVAGAGCMVFPLMVALLAKHSVVGYQGLMWVTMGSVLLMLCCIAASLVVGSRIAKSTCQLQSMAADLVQQQGQGRL